MCFEGTELPSISNYSIIIMTIIFIVLSQDSEVSVVKPLQIILTTTSQISGLTKQYDMCIIQYHPLTSEAIIDDNDILESSVILQYPSGLLVHSNYSLTISNEQLFLLLYNIISGVFIPVLLFAN